MNPDEMIPTTMTDSRPFIMAPLSGAGDIERRSSTVDVFTVPQPKKSPYIVGFAVSDRSIEVALRLRYEIFNLELGEGLATSAIAGLDRDPFDDQMTHLVLIDPATGRIVGTYRVQTSSHAIAGRGLYCATIFEPAGLDAYYANTIEVGRACLAPDHRTLSAIIMLWTGLGVFMNLYDRKYVFGCCSLTTQDPDDGWRAMKTIRAKKYLHPSLMLRARPECSCGPAEREFVPDLGEAIPLPKLFRTYMRMGTQVVSEPAIDRDFGTVDFLVLLDGRTVALSQLDIIT